MTDIELNELTTRYNRVYDELQQALEEYKLSKRTDRNALLRANQLRAEFVSLDVKLRGVK